MASRDRPHREEKKKPKDASQKGINKIQPLLEPPTNVEVWKPKRKPRTEKETES
ncbi:MAG TPA: hypothetical protein VF361_08445 [Candidatus Limnocylindrales bacterium]|jgi:hypothetical protein